MSKSSHLIIAISILIIAIAWPVLAAEETLRSPNYEITWPNVNMGSVGASSGSYNLGVTTGQTAPGLYSYADGTGYKIRAGFQYIHSIIPFYFKLSAIALNFGTLTPEVLTNNQSLTLTVNSGSAGGYQVTVAENNPLTNVQSATIPDTGCDVADSCTQDDEGTWTQITTYGFGYTMSGTDVPSEFSGSKYKNFADAPGENPVKIMGKNVGAGHSAGVNKTAVLSARINVSGVQAAGNYQNILSFVAIPTF